MPEQSYHGDEGINAFRVLQRIQQNSRANLPGMLAQRAMSTFSLQQETAPEEANGTICVMVYPQNPFVGEPEVRRILARDMQPGLINGRAKINDSREVLAEPDEEGDYLYWPGTPEFEQVNALYHVTFALRMYEKFAQRNLPWSFATPRIHIDPHVGNKANAFYNEQERLLGFHTFTLADGTQRSTAESADIVTHETAHAILDGMRDLWNESFGLGPRAFHESFGDITAVLVALQDDALIKMLLDLTGGNLRKTNFVSEVAEHLTTQLADQQTDDSRREDTLYLRNAFNMLRWQSFEELVYMPEDPATQLSRQEHNFSRVFTGAVYDVLVGIYENISSKGVPPFVALFRAGEIVGRLLIAAVEVAPVGEFNFSDMARAFLSADAMVRRSRNRDVLIDVFHDRGILSREDCLAHLKQLESLPDLRLPKTINNALSAAQFLERDVLPALTLQIDDELLPLSTYRNAAGHVFMTFFSARTMQLKGESYRSYDGTSVDMFGGLTLVFNEHNQLQNYVYRPVTAQDQQRVSTIIAEMIAYQRIADQLYPPHLTVSPAPEGLLVPGLRPAWPDAKLVAYPVIVDELPQPLMSFRQYLQQLEGQQGG